MFEELNGPAEVDDPSRAKVEMARQEKETSREASLGKAAMPKEKVSITKVQKSEAGSSSTTEESKGRSCELSGEEKKKSAPGFGLKPRAST